MRRRRRLWRTTAVVWLLPLLAPAPAVPAQEAPAGSPFLPTGHWAAGALRQLYVLELVPGSFDPGQGRYTVAEAASMLAGALSLSMGGPHEELVRALGLRFSEETGRLAAGDSSGARVRTAVRLVAGVEDRSDAISPGSGYWLDQWTGPVHAESAGRSEFVRADGLAVLGPWLAGGLTYDRAERASRLREAYLLARWRGVQGWAGRRFERYGPGESGTIVLAGGAAFTGVGFALARPARLPGPLQRIGDIRFQTFAATAREHSGFERPWFWGARVSFAPVARAGVGISRAAIFGGRGAEPVTALNLLHMLVGKHGSGGSSFENQIVALDAWLRWRLGPVPLLAYLEWGFEDSAGAFTSVPGILAGLEASALPGLPWLSLALERASFAESCCGNPMWYRHWYYIGGWTLHGAPLGHPLGGHGREWSVLARAYLFDARARVSARVQHRDRGEENLFAPDRGGASVAGSLRGEIRFGRGTDIRLEASRENGRGDADHPAWREHRLLLALQLAF